MNPQFWLRALRRLSGFTLSTIVTGLITVIAIPVIIGTTGDTGWSAIAIGQASGLLAGIVAGLGWALTGPGTVAPLAAPDRVRAFEDSLVLRGAVIPVAAAGAVLACVVLTSSYTLAASATACATILTAAGASWYFIGTRNPTGLLFFDTIPRVAGILAGVVLLGVGAPLETYSISQLLGSCASFVLTSVVILRSERREGRRRPLRHFRRVLRDQVHGTVAALSSSIFISLPTLVVATITPSGVAAFALADRIEKLANTALMPIGQTLQGWVPSATPQDVRSRALRSSAAGATAGLLLGVALAISIPLLSLILSGGEIPVGWDLAIPFGLVLAFTITSQSTGMAGLVALGKSRHLMRSAILGAVVCGAFLLAMVPGGGAVAAAWAVVAGEGSTALYQIAALAVAARPKRG